MIFDIEEIKALIEDGKVEERGENTDGSNNS